MPWSRNVQQLLFYILAFFGTRQDTYKDGNSGLPVVADKTAFITCHAIYPTIHNPRANMWSTSITTVSHEDHYQQYEKAKTPKSLCRQVLL